MRVLFFWEPNWRYGEEPRSNPYADCLTRALEKLDVHLSHGDYGLHPDWLEANRSEFDVLHLNWLHYFYRHDNLEDSVCRLRRFMDHVLYAKRLGYRVVWTLHNTYPHERNFPDIDHLARVFMAQAADGVVAHCQTAAGFAADKFFRSGGIEVVPHGHFMGVYPNRVSRAAARRRFDIPDGAFVYLFFGNARRYKGLRSLIQSYRRVCDDQTRLLLMLREEFDLAYANEIVQFASGDPQIMLHSSSWFEKDELQYFLNASDVAVLPFDEILTSGSAITALSFGLPVVLPAIGCMPDLIDGACGILFDRSPNALDAAMRRARQMDLAAARIAAFDRAKSLDWDEIAIKFAAVYEQKRSSATP